jgi:tyrosyl-tRNA synthetase
MLLQAYDFVRLNQDYNCELQIGGSDQWGNVTAGIDLGRRMLSKQLYGITCPLLTKSDGAKMGKTESGAIWLSADRTSPYEFFQYWRNVDDNDVDMCLKFLTELSEEEISSLAESRAADAAKRESQIRLAEEVTTLIHGEAGLKKAKLAGEVLFGAEISDLSDVDLNQIFTDVPSAEFPLQQLESEGLSLIDALALAGLCKSKGEARRTIKEGGAYVNNVRQSDIEKKLTPDDRASESIIVLRRGKKKFALVKLV